MAVVGTLVLCPDLTRGKFVKFPARIVALHNAAMAYRIEGLLMRQHPETIKALRVHLAARGILVPTDKTRARSLVAVFDGEDRMLFASVCDPVRLTPDQFADFVEIVAGIEGELPE